MAEGGNEATVGEEELAHTVDAFFTTLQGFLPPPSPAPGSSGDGASPCVLFELHGMPYFYLVGGSHGVQRVPVSLVETRASCRVSCELSVLLGLLMGTLKPLAAVASGKLRVTGDRSTFRAIGPSLRRAAKQFMSENPNALGGRLKAAGNNKGGTGTQREEEGLLLGLGPEVERLLLRLDRSEWEDDAARRQCTLCHKAFTLLGRRRHHCRMCGGLFCHNCSQQRLLGHRVCSKCTDLILHTYVSTYNPPTPHTEQQHTQRASYGPDTTPPSNTGMRQRRSSSLRASNANARSSLPNGLPNGSNGWTPNGPPGLAPASAHYLGVIQHRIDSEQCQEISWEEPVKGEEGSGDESKEDMAAEAPPPLHNKTQFVGGWVGVCLLSSFHLSALSLTVLPLLLLPSPPPLLLLLLLLLLLCPRPLLPTCVPAFLLTACLTDPPLPHPLDATLVSLLSSYPTASLLSLPLLLSVWVPLRYWLYRGVHIYGSAVAVIGVYVALSKYCKIRGYHEDDNSRAVYECADVLMAPLVARQFVSLKSLFLKFGQYIGGRADVVPPRWATCLSVLQDQLPPCPPAYVRSLLSSAFESPLEQLFSAFAFTPIASASVAQVHKATLAKDGTEVVVKVQHEHVEATMRADMAAATRIAKWMAWLNGDYVLLLRVLTSWAKEMDRELDFRIEASNLERASENLRRAGIDVLVPLPVESLVAKKALVMTYIKGFKITDQARLDHFKIDRTALMRRVAQACSSMLFVDGFFNADPHAGNVMVSVSGEDKRARPVLLDFGMTVEVCARRREGYCRLVHCANSLDLYGASHALHTIGYVTTQSTHNPERDVEFFQFLMRDTGSREEQRQGAEQFTKRRQQQKEEDKKQGRATSRYMKEVPSELFFLFRMLGLIRGLCTTLGVTIPYLDTLALYAHKGALLLHMQQQPLRLTHTPQHAGTEVPRGVSMSSAPLYVLEVKLRQAMHSLLHNHNKAIGLQVCVVRGGEVLLEVSGGVLGALDPTPVNNHSLFPVLDLGNVLTALLLHAYARDGTLRYDVPLHHYWPSFLSTSTPRPPLPHPLATPPSSPSPSIAPAPVPLANETALFQAYEHKRSITLRHLLSHSWGLHKALPPDTPPSLLTDPDHCQHALSTALPLFPPGSKAVHDVSLMGHAACALLRQVGGGIPLPIALTDRITRPLHIQDEVYLGGEGAGGLGEWRLAKLHNGYAPQVKTLMMQAHTTSNATPNANANDTSTAAPSSTTAAAVPSGEGVGMGDMEGFLTHPTCANEAWVRQSAVCPSLNALASAHALALVLYHSLAVGGSKVMSRSQQAALLKGLGGQGGVEEDSALFGRRRWHLGLQMDTNNQRVVGHEAFGGSLAVFYPSSSSSSSSSSGVSTSIAITTNCLTLDKAPTRHLLHLLCRELDLPMPSFATQGLFT